MDNSSLRFLIVEDNTSYSVELEMLVEELGYQVIAIADNSATALEVIYADKPDFILMDIDINGKMTGLDIAEAIQDKEIPVLFLSSFTDEAHTSRAEALSSIGYLTKPISAISLKTAIRMAVKNIYLAKGKKSQSEPNEEEFMLDNFLFFKKKNTYHKVPISDIQLLCSTDGYTTVYTDEKTHFITRNTLSYFEEFLNPRQFMRVSRSAMVALDKISSIDFFENSISILGESIPMTKTAKRDLTVLMQRME